MAREEAAKQDIRVLEQGPPARLHMRRVVVGDSRQHGAKASFTRHALAEESLLWELDLCAFYIQAIRAKAHNLDRVPQAFRNVVGIRQKKPAPHLHLGVTDGQ